MEELQAESRFQAGVAAARAGLVSTFGSQRNASWGNQPGAM
jgi:hypothetical protein